MILNFKTCPFISNLAVVQNTSKLNDTAFFAFNTSFSYDFGFNLLIVYDTDCAVCMNGS